MNEAQLKIVRKARLALIDVAIKLKARPTLEDPVYRRDEAKAISNALDSIEELGIVSGEPHWGTKAEAAVDRAWERNRR